MHQEPCLADIVKAAVAGHDPLDVVVALMANLTGGASRLDAEGLAGALAASRAITRVLESFQRPVR